MWPRRIFGVTIQKLCSTQTYPPWRKSICFFGNSLSSRDSFVTIAFWGLGVWNYVIRCKKEQWERFSLLTSGQQISSGCVSGIQKTLENVIFKSLPWFPPERCHRVTRQRCWVQNLRRKKPEQRQQQEYRRSHHQHRMLGWSNKTNTPRQFFFKFQNQKDIKSCSSLIHFFPHIVCEIVWMYFSEPASCKDGAVPIGAPIGANGKAKSPPVGGWRWLGEAEPNPVFWWQYKCRKLELDDDTSRSGGSAASQLRKMSLSEAKQKKKVDFWPSP